MRFLFWLAALALGGGAFWLGPAPARAATAWEEIRPLVFEARPILPGDDFLSLTAPTRPRNQAFVPVELAAELRDGRVITAITFIIDENPAPVAARFTLGGARHKLRLATRLRFNSATDVRAVVETSDGQLYMVARHVKFAGGQAACSAPATGDPAELAASMGRMELAREPAAPGLSPIRPSATLTIRHPNHSGMVLDQITLLHVPQRIVSHVEVRQGDDLVFAMRGSMSLSQDPQVSFDYPVNGADLMRVTVRDSDDATWSRAFPLGPGS